MSGNRDDFSKNTKDTLGHRTGWKCSNPNCRKDTSGASEEKGKHQNIGVAAHIYAAAPGGPRFDENMTKEERSSIDNGIWLCQNCAKMIDSDVERYTPELLKKWKKEAENESMLRMENKISIQDISKISIEDRNLLIFKIRRLQELFNLLYKDYKNHRVAIDYRIDAYVYQICYSIFNIANEIKEIEGKYHLQFQNIGIDKKIIEITKNIPAVFIEEGDGSGIISTVYDFLNFSNSEDRKKYIKICKSVINNLEK